MSKKKYTVLLLVMAMASACGRASTPAPVTTPGNGGDTTKITTPADPATAATIGFFLNNWHPRTFTAPDYKTGTVPATTTTEVLVDASTIVSKLTPTLFGNNANPYMTQMVTQSTLMGHITNLHPGIIRFPGGNISSVYFWNAAPGNPPADAPAKIQDANGNATDPGYWYGNNDVGYTLSLTNYYNMLQQTGNEGIITINYGYARYGTSADPVAAAAHLAADWVRFDNGRTRYWEIGNESNGTWQAGYRIDPAANKDGQPEIITGELYGKHFKVFADSMRKAAAETGKQIYIGAQMLETAPASWANNTDKNWNSGLLQQSANSPDYYIIHSYFTPYNTNSTPAEILATGTSNPKGMADYVAQCWQTAGTTPKPIALTEWNIFATGSKQMVSQVAGVHAAIVLEELMKRGYGMASRWDLANGWNNGDDHGLFSQGEAASGETKWTPRPAFYYMYMLQKTQGDRVINASVTKGSADILAYASTFTGGQLQAVLVNKGSTSESVALTFKNFKTGSRYYWYTLDGGSTTFSRTVSINGEGPASGTFGGPASYTTIKAYGADAGQGIKVTVPPLSVTILQMEKQ
ncbi:alpha-L-arabinofuranosidase [Chitinophaga sp. Cy-1792]|uniref:alpha-L-arabinofuranosidase n=1 Tax=Chitinophaga sp. Cy-1792 TaxID=2608339 RepID=UPI00141D8CCB|nr:alpha-L-arabinofuranosidase [Chitinophaga sp. Cy-1792]NIG55572.1 alpha-L-arabinofuranosidase [Chitinophaga sp. Cy-1792]